MEENPRLNDSDIKKIRERDRKKDLLAKKYGYDTIRIDDSKLRDVKYLVQIIESNKEKDDEAKAIKN